MGLTRPILSRIIQPVSKEAIGFQRDELIRETIGNAFYNLGFNRAKADNIGSYLIKQNPSIDGTVYDETPNRKTRTELTARATSFNGVNQYFSSIAKVTSSGITALSVGCWLNSNSAANTDTLISEYLTTGDERSWRIHYEAQNIEVILSEDGAIDSSSTKRYITSGNLAPASEFVHVLFTWSAADDELLIYINGQQRATTVVGGLDATITTLHDTSHKLCVSGIDNGGATLNGKIQLPLIWESALSAAEVRDLYLQKYDKVTTPTMGWFLDGVNAYPLTSSSPALTAANTPTRYEDSACPDYLNLHGWNESGGTVYPKRINSNVDSNGNPPDNAHSFGECKRNFQLLDGPCFSFGGTEYATNGNLVGTETVVSSEGTSTPTISAGRIDFTAGTCWNLLLSNGSHYAGSEEAGIIWHDDVNDEHLTFVNTPSWSTQDTYFWSEANGFSLYEHASSADILVPLKSDGTAITITPPTGYTKTADYPPGAYHHDSQALLEEFPVTDSGSQRAVGYGASFNGTTSVINFGDIGNTTEIQFDLYVPNVTGTKAVFQLASGDYVQLNAATLEANDIAGATFYVDGIAGTTIAASAWHTVKVTYTTYDSTAVLIGKQSSSFLTGYVRNLTFKNGSSKVVDSPLYRDSLDRSPNCNHGTETAITYLTEARAANLNPTISQTNTRAVTTGDRKLIRIGQQ